MKYLEPTNLCESNDPAIIDLAKEIVNDKIGEDAAKALFYWVRDNVTWDIEPIVGAKAALERNPRKAICIDKSNIMVAFCRAVGIPARYVVITGRLKVKRPELDVDMLHVAAEVLVNDKWILADPGYGEETKSIIEVSQFGEPIWIEDKLKEINRMEELPAPLFPDQMNEGLKKHPVAEIYKKLLKEIRSK